jgi:nucleoside-diphosphate-sugar epimerase
LLEAGHQVTILSRGGPSKSPFRTNLSVAHVACNRHNRGFGDFLDSCGAFDAVIDFCAYEPADVEPIVRMGSRAGHYVLISTDSVYMAFDPAAFERREGRLTEASAVRPTDPALREARAKGDAYGSAKLDIEQLLGRARAERGFAFTALRLPDVFGPHENTGRQRRLLARLRARKAVGLKVGGRASVGALELVSMLYGPDAGSAVRAVLDAGERAHGLSLNVCASEASTWQHFVQTLAASLHSSASSGQEGDAAAGEERAMDVPVGFDERKDTGYLSTDVGPIDNSNALRVLGGWSPTPLELAIRQTAEWALREAREHGRKRQREQALRCAEFT